MTHTRSNASNRLLDDHPAVLAGLRRLIDAEPDLSVAAVAASAPELARELDGLGPDVLILDYDLARDPRRSADVDEVLRPREAYETS